MPATNAFFSPRSSATRTRSGAAVVELAITLPFLLVMIVGALELGHANMVLNVAEAAAYEGAREGIVPGSSASDITQACQSILDISSVRNATIQTIPADLSQASETIEVRISVPYDSNTLMPPFFVRGLNIGGICRLSRESQ